MRGARLRDKVTLVTGAGSAGPGWGNGKAADTLFAREGARIFAVDLNAEAVGKPGESSTMRAGTAPPIKLMCRKPIRSS